MAKPAEISTYFYTANRPGGGTSLGFRNAKNRPQLAEQLRRDKLILRTSYPVPLATGKDRGLTLKDQAVLNEQLAQLLSRGVPLIEALEVVSQTVHVGARPRIEKLRDMVASGSSFSDAAGSAAGLDAVTCAIYRAAERTGDLAGAAKQLSITARRTLQVAGRATTLLIYPAIVLSVSVVVALIMLIFIVPKLGEQLASNNAKVPWYTRILVFTGNILSENLAIFMVLVTILGVIAFFARKQIFYAITSFSRRLPLMSSLVMAQESARFFAVMAAMTRSGVPLADGLAVANQAVSHPTLKSQMERLRTKLVEGGVLRTLIEQVDALPLGTRKMLIAAERSGDLESAFNTLAGDMTEEVERRSARLPAILQPMLIIIMFSIIGSLLMAILVPILNMSGNVGN
ncbi:MAG: type II secretion system F family protein [Phycisphaerales bacterium]|nr:type II secretion system F family protein [Phycisphaerales bacterium]